MFVSKLSSFKTTWLPQPLGTAVYTLCVWFGCFPDGPSEAEGGRGEEIAGG